MSNEDLRMSAKSALLWLGGASILRDVLQFAATIILARLLSPEVYGQSALAQTILGFLAVFSFRSFVNFALQQRNPAQFDWRTHLRVGVKVNALVFLVSNAASALLWLFWGGHFGTVSIVLSVMSVSFLLEPFASLRTTWLQAHHEWQRLRIIELTAAFVSAAGGIALAFAGAGVFALAAMTPLQQIPAIIDFLFFRERAAKLRGTHEPDYRGAKSFGFNRLGSGIVATSVSVFEQSLLTSMFGFATLGLYNRAIGLVNITSGRIGPLVVQSIYPVLTRADAGSDRFRRYSGMLIRSIIAVVAPAAAFLVYEASPLVEFLFGAKWTGAAAFVPLTATYVTIGSMNLVLYQIMLANLQQKTCLKIDIGAAISRLGVVVFMLPLGMIPFLFGLTMSGTAVLLASIEIARRNRSINGWISMKSILPVGCATALSILVLYLIPDFSDARGLFLGNIFFDAVLYSVTYIALLRLAAANTLLDIIEGIPVGENSRLRARKLLMIK